MANDRIIAAKLIPILAIAILWIILVKDLGAFELILLDMKYDRFKFYDTFEE